MVKVNNPVTGHKGPGWSGVFVPLRLSYVLVNFEYLDYIQCTSKRSIMISSSFPVVSYGDTEEKIFAETGETRN